ncbi:hypothetical protein X922_09605 [Pseudomonas aeruginosa VRFPA08]|nr:hypothetical protein X922_09605 [Pseudomonas aeruginosa VRFPA08]
MKRKAGAAGAGSRTGLALESGEVVEDVGHVVRVFFFLGQDFLENASGGGAAKAALAVRVARARPRIREAFMTVTPSGLSIALESFSVRISRFKNEVR